MPELTQNEYGRWKLKGVRHDFPGVTIHARYTYPYYNGQTEEFDITDQPGEDILTRWETELGAPITVDEIRKEYDECICGGTKYVVTNHEFQVVPYDLQPTISMEPDKNVVPYVGTVNDRTVVVDILVENGNFSGYTLSNQNIATAELNLLSDSYAQLVLVFNQDAEATVTRELTVTGYGINGSKICSGTTTISQTKNWSLSDVDYVLFTYEWGEEDGKDLDSFTFIDGLSDSTGGTYGFTFEKGVGYGNGTRKSIPGSSSKREYYLGDDYDNTLLKMACDNTQSGGEYTLINFKRLNECIEDAISKGEIPLDRNVVTVYLTGSWFDVKRQGKCNISFSAYKGDDCVVELVPVGTSTTKYTYEITDYGEKEEKTVEDIDVYAGNGMHGINDRQAIKQYTTIAAFEYFFKENRFELITGEDLKSLDGGRRYQEGVYSTKNGQMVVSGSHSESRNYAVNPTIDITADIINEREYIVTFDNCVYTYYTGTTAYSQNLRMIPDSCAPYDQETPQGDSAITLEQVSDTSFKVTVPSGHIYGGSALYGYRVYYKLQYDDSKLGYEYLRDLSPYVDLNEKQQS